MLNTAKDLVDVTCFRTPTASRLGLPSYDGTIIDLTATTPDALRVVFSDVPAMLHLVPNTLEPTFLFKGLAYLDGSLDVSATGAVSWSSKWVAAGPWVMEPAIP
jgi:hypothetical protein